MGGYGVFDDGDKYVKDTSALSALERRVAAQKKKARDQEEAGLTRKQKPVTSWTLKDVAMEFHQRFHLKYPMHSPDELSYPQLIRALGGISKNDGVTPEEMVRAIDEFFRSNMGERYPNYPAWRKFLWKIRDQRDRNPEVYANTMRKSSRQGTIKKTVRSVEALLAEDPAVAERRARKRLEERRQELEHWLDEQRRHGDWVLVDGLGENWATIIREWMKEVGYERPDESPSGPA